MDAGSSGRSYGCLVEETAEKDTGEKDTGESSEESVVVASADSHIFQQGIDINHFESNAVSNNHSNGNATGRSNLEVEVEVQERASKRSQRCWTRVAALGVGLVHGVAG
jgi:hypothetical protein